MKQTFKGLGAWLLISSPVVIVWDYQQWQFWVMDFIVAIGLFFWTRIVRDIPVSNPESSPTTED